MAFNPFHGFRKHKKVVFAALTIICMFTFILSGGMGRGDPIERLLNLFGSSRHTGALVVTLHGKKIYQNDIDKLRLGRDLANRLALQAAGEAREQAAFELMKTLEPLEKRTDTTDLDRRFRESVSSILRNLPTARNPQARMFSFLFDQNNQRRLEALGLSFMDLRSNPKGRQLLLEAVLDDRMRLLSVIVELKGAQREGDAQKCEDLLKSLDVEAWEYSELDPSDALFFGGGFKTEEDLLDFYLWRLQADRLGIQLTEADIRNELARRVGRNNVVTENGANTLKYAALVSPRKDITLDLGMVYQALGDELRVAMAQAAYLGREPGFGGVRQILYQSSKLRVAAGDLTPEEFFKFFKDNRTALKAEFLPIPVAAFKKKDTPPPRTPSWKSCSTSTRTPSRPRRATCRPSRSRAASRSSG
jgi:hypothetical protein